MSKQGMFLVLLFLSTMVRADVTDLNTALAAKDYQQAWLQALELREELEGDADFDFAYGLAGIETGHVNEAVFAFERVLANFPGQHRARLELARAYYLLGDYDAADRELRLVEASSPPEAVVQNIALFRQRLMQNQSYLSSRWQNSVHASFGADTNIASATDSSRIEIPSLGSLLLSGSALPQDDTYHALGASFAWLKPINKMRMFNLQVNIDSKNFHRSDDYDQLKLAFGMGLQQVIGQHRFTLAGRVQHLNLNQHSFQRLRALSLGWQKGLAKHWSLGVTALYNDIRYPQDSLRDLRQGIAAFNLSEDEGLVAQTFSVLLGSEVLKQAVYPHNAKKFYALMYEGSIDFWQSHEVYARAYWQRSEHKARDPLFSPYRKDDMYRFNAGWIWRPTSDVQIYTEASHTDNQSNIELYTYDRWVSTVGVRYAFD